MCGFVGFTNPKPENISGNILKNMLHLIDHRGPDRNSFCIEKNIALGHQRLSIIDLNGGNQPRGDNDAKLVYNGEIYGYLELAKTLRSKGILLKDNSDTEILFQLLKLYGVEKTLTMIDGMFSFAFYEIKNDTLWLARDPMGEKPLYYSVKEDGIIFGSEISSLMPALNPIKHTIDESALISYLHLDYIPHEKTILSNIRKVMPGQIIKYKNNSIKKSFYTNSKFNNNIHKSFKSPTEQLDKLLNQSVKDRLIADVPVGVFLSGGIDSSLIAYYAKKNNNSIKSYTIKMDSNSYDESAYAKLAAQKLGIDNKIAEFDNNSILNSLEIIEKKLDEPLSDPSILPTFLLSQFARKEVKVALSGDGADELFCGYAPFKAIKFLFILALFPKAFGNFITNVTESIPSKDAYMSLHFLIKHVSRGLGWPSYQQVFRWMSPLSDRNISNILNQETAAKMDVKNTWDNLLKSNNYKNKDITNILSKQFQEFYLPNDILTKVDRASMLNSLEVRSPFLAKSIVNFSNTLPNEFKVKNNQTKVILRQIASNILPKNISSRKKHGFAIPLAQMIRGPLKEKIEDTLLSNNILISRYFNKEKLEILLKDHSRGIDNRKPIWAIYMLYKNIERLLKCT